MKLSLNIALIVSVPYALQNYSWVHAASVAAPTSIVAGSLTSIALLKTPDDGLRFLEECAIPYFAVDQQLGCHGNLGEVCHA